MKFEIILVSFFLFFVSSCRSLNEDAPSRLISPDKMARILANIHEAEMQVSRMGLGGFDSSKIAYDFLESNIFENYGVDSSQYRKSYEYYAANPSQFIRIYENVESIIEEKTKK